VKFYWYKDTDGGRTSTVELQPQDLQSWDGLGQLNGQCASKVEQLGYRIWFNCPSGRGMAQMALEFELDDILELLDVAIEKQQEEVNRTLHRLWAVPAPDAGRASHGEERPDRDSAESQGDMRVA